MEFAEAVDVLFIDEAGQMSLANVLAVAQAAANIVLLGDPQQLEQPSRGNHPEGAEVSALEHLLDGVTWTDRHGRTAPLTAEDILIVAPYNAHVSAIAARLPGAKVGTVDRFQGQEAPVVIYSLATSSPEEAPRGMEFLYSLNRLNVATSRARCACILVANPLLFEPECRTPHQMRLANAFCRYLELATVWH